MQSPKYQPTIFNPVTRLGETPVYMPVGLNPFESRKNAIPVAVLSGSRPSNEYQSSSPNYSPIIHAEDKTKKEEEEDDYL